MSPHFRSRGTILHPYPDTMSELLAEIRKIPPVTRFVCASIIAVTLPVMTKIVSPYTMVFVKDFVIKKGEVRLPAHRFCIPQLISCVHACSSGEFIPLSSSEVCFCTLSITPALERTLSRIGDKLHLRPGDAIVSTTALPPTHIFSPFAPPCQSRNASALESYYDSRSADLAWQLLFASASIIVRTRNNSASTHS